MEGNSTGGRRSNCPSVESELGSPDEGLRIQPGASDFLTFLIATERGVQQMSKALGAQEIIQGPWGSRVWTPHF